MSRTLARAGREGLVLARVLGAPLVTAALFLSTISLAASDPSPVTVELTIKHSRFLPSVVEVDPGEEVRFVVRNLDPIAHELIVGPEEVQLRHESGTEPDHGAVPGEVSVPGGETRTTTYRFDGRGVVPFGCHLPGHWAYGMRGAVLVV